MRAHGYTCGNCTEKAQMHALLTYEHVPCQTQIGRIYALSPHTRVECLGCRVRIGIGGRVGVKVRLTIKCTKKRGVSSSSASDLKRDRSGNHAYRLYEFKLWYKQLLNALVLLTLLQQS